MFADRPAYISQLRNAWSVCFVVVAAVAFVVGGFVTAGAAVVAAVVVVAVVGVVVAVTRTRTHDRHARTAKRA